MPLWRWQWHLGLQGTTRSAGYSLQHPSGCQSAPTVGLPSSGCWGAPALWMLVEGEAVGPCLCCPLAERDCSVVCGWAGRQRDPRAAAELGSAMLRSPPPTDRAGHIPSPPRGAVPSACTCLELEPGGLRWPDRGGRGLHPPVGTRRARVPAAARRATNTSTVRAVPGLLGGHGLVGAHQGPWGRSSSPCRRCLSQCWWRWRSRWWQCHWWWCHRWRCHWWRCHRWR